MTDWKITLTEHIQTGIGAGSWAIVSTIFTVKAADGPTEALDVAMADPRLTDAIRKAREMRIERVEHEHERTQKDGEQKRDEDDPQE